MSSTHSPATVSKVTIIHKAHASAPADTANGIPGSLLALLAAGAGLAVACLYYNQPMLAVIGADIGASNRAMGFVPTMTQLGYALGILLLAPLGDRFDRRRIILIKGAALIGALLLAGAATSVVTLLLASLSIGLAATMAQDIVPAAATLAPESHRGNVVGKVMTGLLLGILLSRVVSGFVAEHFGWRTMFLTAAVSIGGIWTIAWRMLPTFAPTTQLPYTALLASLAALWQRYPALRRAALAQGLLSLAFSAFWSTLAVMLHATPFHLGSAAAGAFGLAGAAGAAVAPVAGRIADKRGPELVTRLGAALVALSFAVMSLSSGLAVPAQLWVLALGAIGFDLGIHASLIAHQSIVYGLEPAARSRLNAMLFASMFIGMALGSAMGGLLLAKLGWASVTTLATVAAITALAVRMWPKTDRA